MSEQSLQQSVCTYLHMQYPHVLFNSDLSGIRLTMGQAVKLKTLRSSRAFPDLMIFEPRGSFHGLFLELKVHGTRLLKRNGEFASEHIMEQSEMIDQLMKRGYYASFAVGFDQAKKLINAYMNLDK